MKKYNVGDTAFIPDGFMANGTARPYKEVVVEIPAAGPNNIAKVCDKSGEIHFCPVSALYHVRPF